MLTKHKLLYLTSTAILTLDWLPKIRLKVLQIKKYRIRIPVNIYKKAL